MRLTDTLRNGFYAEFSFGNPCELDNNQFEHRSRPYKDDQWTKISTDFIHDNFSPALHGYDRCYVINSLICRADNFLHNPLETLVSMRLDTVSRVTGRAGCRFMHKMNILRGDEWLYEIEMIDSFNQWYANSDTKNTKIWYAREMEQGRTWIVLSPHWVKRDNLFRFIDWPSALYFLRENEFCLDLDETIARVGLAHEVRIHDFSSLAQAELYVRHFCVAKKETK